ncbi:hypothetical protein GUITHDRAFT_118014 [Guillardia theta CCMP2712]|uniref:Uncharacterized protein n=1 Tax=Guillardia theta (strain CCMP2712) TaxID=905079 RepID=L1IIF8_GUITC|nr:hypothetical protein GUITHDRAFT_118014 [Guillardia theta CCMP2712]EKX35867.1 hypothetical protein GUITHDRAFT_118014 [Guillardia theta CCMP2712]|eukprot:XP_005822847.1 hypothetical protein GUITHDRAFT_118014 [Guillardia theta CCMP2712]
MEVASNSERWSLNWFCDFLTQILFATEFLSLKEDKAPIKEKAWANIVCCCLTGKCREEDGKFFIGSNKHEKLEEVKMTVNVHKTNDASLVVSWKQAVGFITAKLSAPFVLNKLPTQTPSIHLMEMLECQLAKKQGELKSLKSEEAQYKRLIETLKSEKDSLEKRSKQDKKQIVRGAVTKLNKHKSEIEQWLERKLPRDDDYHTSDSDSPTATTAARQDDQQHALPSSMEQGAIVVPDEEPTSANADSTREGLQARPRKRNKRRQEDQTST